MGSRGLGIAYIDSPGGLGAVGRARCCNRMQGPKRQFECVALLAVCLPDDRRDATFCLLVSQGLFREAATDPVGGLVVLRKVTSLLGRYEGIDDSYLQSAMGLVGPLTLLIGPCLQGYEAYHAYPLFVPHVCRMLCGEQFHCGLAARHW